MQPRDSRLICRELLGLAVKVEVSPTERLDETKERLRLYPMNTISANPGPLVQGFPCSAKNPAMLVPLGYIVGSLLFYFATSEIEGAWIFLVSAAYFVFVLWLVRHRTPKHVAVHDQGIVVTRRNGQEFHPWADIREFERDTYQHKVSTIQIRSFTLHLKSGTLSLPYDEGLLIWNCANETLDRLNGHASSDGADAPQSSAGTEAG